MHKSDAISERPGFRIRPPQYFEDSEIALGVVADGEKLTPRQWAAWMAHKTGIHTYQVCRDTEGGIVGFGVSVQGDLNYLRPSEITARIARTWGKQGAILSSAELVWAVMMLDYEDQRAYALEGFGALQKDRDVQSEQEAEVNQRIRAFADRHTMAAPSIGSNEVPEPAVLTLFQPMTEPPEKFAAELEDLKQGKTRRGKPSLVAGFYGEEA